MGKITDFLKKIGLLKAGTDSYSGKDYTMVDEVHSAQDTIKEEDTMQDREE